MASTTTHDAYQTKITWPSWHCLALTNQLRFDFCYTVHSTLVRVTLQLKQLPLSLSSPSGNLFAEYYCSLAWPYVVHCSPMLDPMLDSMSDPMSDPMFDPMFEQGTEAPFAGEEQRHAR